MKEAKGKWEEHMLQGWGMLISYWKLEKEISVCLLQ